MKENLIRPIVCSTLGLDEAGVGVICGLNCTLIVIKRGYQLIDTDREKVEQALHDALDPAYVTYGLIRFI